MNKKEKQKIIDGIEKLSIVTVEGIAGVLIHKSSVLKLLNAMPEEKADNIFCGECGELVGVGTIMHDINAMPEDDFSPPCAVVKTMVPGDAVVRYADNSYGLETEAEIAKGKWAEYWYEHEHTPPLARPTFPDWLDREEV